MADALKAFEEELQSKNFKGYWQNVQGDLGQRRFSVQTSAGGGTRDLPLSASTIDPSAGQYIRQTVHFG